MGKSRKNNYYSNTPNSSKGMAIAKEFKKVKAYTAKILSHIYLW